MYLLHAREGVLVEPLHPLLGCYGSVVRPGLVALLWLRGREIGDLTTGSCWDWFVVVKCTPYPSLGISRSPYMFVLSPLKYPVPQICWLASSDVPVSALRARLMADAVGTVAVVEELAISPPANRTSPTSAAAGESLVVGLPTLESISFSLGKNVIAVPATRFQ